MEAGQGVGHGQPQALRQPSQGGWASAASPAVWMQLHPLPPSLSFPICIVGVQPHAPSIRKHWTLYPEMGQEGPQWGEEQGGGSHSTRDDPWGLFSGRRWGGNLQTLCAGPLGRTGQIALGPCLQEAPILPHLQAILGPSSLGTSTAEPRSPCSGTEAGARYYGESQSWGPACRVAVGLETSPEPLPQWQPPLLALGWGLNLAASPPAGVPAETDLF